MPLLWAIEMFRALFQNQAVLARALIRQGRMLWICALAWILVALVNFYWLARAKGWAS
jgi:hypothetical protein